MAQKIGILYHLVQKDMWDQAKQTRQKYAPPTYEKDGFTHLTDKSNTLIAIGNLFYKEVKGDFLVLKIDGDKLTGEVKFETAADVGDKKTDDNQLGANIFPHLYGLIDFESVLEEQIVVRSENGEFLEVK
eukprot:TRINITY_DN72639_c0_g1_i2.p2 TRINITY_DN72639_c0_g1~~TRINITY_DN72639_c0_g1_i2.p2  ORF type:complete len:130 (+),score=18.46 TRINITY_DN72639_c0_g1_i2:107-496(+)